jgi:hypothetical protein
MKDYSTADVVDTTTPLSIFTPRSQRLPSPPDPRLPSVVPRTSSPFSRRRRTISGAVSVEREDNISKLGQTALRYDIPGCAAPFTTLGWEAPVSEQDFVSSGAGTGQKARPDSIACAPRELAVSLSSAHELKPALQITPSVIRRKRPSDVRTPDSSGERLHTKRPRIRPRLNHSLDGLKFDGPIQQPPSPLFFSNTQRQRPTLPARFSSSEAAARMLSKARHEETHVKTVSLARGTVPTSAHASYHNTSTPTSISRQSLDRSSTTRSDSPDTGSHSGKNSTSSPGQQNLNSIGIIELLEQDERPTLIIDLSDSTNYGPGPLYPAYVSSSLRSCEGLYEHIVGTSEAALQFKSWLSSPSVNKEGLNISLPTCQYANFLWSCSTLRRTLRVVSGTLLSSPGFKISVSSSLTQSVGSLSMGPTSAPMSGIEPSDYFGHAIQAPEQFATKNISNAPVSSIEGAIPTTAVLSALEGNTGIADQQTPTDVMPSPSTYVMDGIPLAPAAPAVTNVNWFSSHIPVAHSISPSFDWTRLPVSDAMPEHIRFARSIDWASTSLGPIGTWGSDLRQMCNLIMASPHPAAMYWGDDLIAIYNEAYIMLAGQKHPSLMGQSYSVAWSEIWDDVKDVFANARLTGEATMKDDDGLFLKRSNYLEETYFSWSIVSHYSTSNPHAWICVQLPLSGNCDRTKIWCWWRQYIYH